MLFDLVQPFLRAAVSLELAIPLQPVGLGLELAEISILL